MTERLLSATPRHGPGLGPGLLLGLLLGLVNAPAAAVESALADARFAGVWSLDRERSDDAADALADALRDLARDLRPPNPSRPNRGGLSRQPARSALGRDLFGAVRLPKSALMIELDPAWVRFALDDGPGEQIFTDQRASVVDADNPSVRLGSWEDQVLWIERSSDRGTRVIESWRRDGVDLVADYEVRNALLEEPLEFTLIFIRSGGGAPSP